MKAYVLNAIGQLDYTETKKPSLKEGEILLSVKASGICGSDIPRIYENGTYHFPTIPGHEFAGVAVETHSDRQKHLLGKRFGVFPLIPCQKCTACKNKNYEMCSSYGYLGSRSDGGFAEYVAVPEWNLIELPDDISFEAAAMLEPAAVGIHALKRIDINRIDSAVVFGPGPIGFLMAQWLRYFGVEEIMIVGTREEQRILSKELGFEHFINRKSENMAETIAAFTKREGPALCIECTGHGSVLCDCIRVAKQGGVILTVGNPHSDITLSRDIYWKILRNQLHISGTWNSSFDPESEKDDWKMAIRAIQNGSLMPEKQITHKLDFGNLYTGLEIMRDRLEYYNKVMIVRK